MNVKDTLKKLQEELDGMHASLDELRVKGNLGKMELRDKLSEFQSALDPAYQKAKSTILELSKSGADEYKTMSASLVAGWDELRKTHKRLSEELDREKA